MTAASTAPRTVIACAHRGDPHAHRENTMPAVVAGIAAGAGMVEIDVELTADGVLVLLHDHSLERLWGHPRDVSAMTYAEVEAACTGPYRIPAFAECLGLLAASDVTLMVDLNDPHIATLSVAALVERGLLHKALFAGDHTAMKAVRAAAADARIALSLDTIDGLPAPDELRALAPAYINPHWVVLDQSLVDRWHADGYGVSCWTVDSPSAMARLMDMGVDVVISNRIGILVDLLAARQEAHRAE